MLAPLMWSSGPPQARYPPPPCASGCAVSTSPHPSWPSSRRARAAPSSTRWTSTVSDSPPSRRVTSCVPGGSPLPGSSHASLDDLGCSGPRSLPSPSCPPDGSISTSTPTPSAPRTRMARRATDLRSSRRHGRPRRVRRAGCANGHPRPRSGSLVRDTRVLLSRRHRRHRYIDGGVHSPTNADCLRGDELDVVIVSSPMSAAGGRAFTPDAPWRWSSHRRLHRELGRLRRKGIKVITFEPTGRVLAAMGLNPMSSDRSDRVMRAAFFAAGAHALRPEIAAMLAPIARRPNRAGSTTEAPPTSASTP
jgi:hypothetical protein